MSARNWLIAITALACLCPATSFAETNAEAQRLMQRREAERYFVKTPRSAIEAGAARIHVRSSPDAVRRALLAYGEYPSFIPKFSRARVFYNHFIEMCC